MMRRTWLRYASAYGFYVLVAVWMTFPLVTQMNTAFPGAPESDAYEYARHIWWYKHAILNGEPLFFHPTLAHPDGLPSLWLWAIPLQSFPAWLFSFVMPLPVAYNIMTLLRLALNGWAVYFLMRRLLDGTHDNKITDTPDLPALLSGAIFALYPTIQGQMFGSHVGIIAVWGSPLYVDALLRLRNHNHWRDYLLAAVFFVCALLGSNLLLVVMLFPLTLFIVLKITMERQWMWLRRVILAVMLGGLLSTVFVIPATVEQLTSESAVDPGGVVRFSADLLAVVSPSFFHPIYRQLNYPAQVLGTNIVEGTGYIGIVALLLVVIGVWRMRPARGWLYLALFAWVLSLGPILKILDQPVTITIDNNATYIPLPFAAPANLPVLNITRTPARFNLTVGLAVAIMAGYGICWLWQWLRSQWLRYVIFTVLLIAIAFDYHQFWNGFLPDFPTISAQIPDEIAELRDDDSIRAVLNLPYNNLLVAKEAMYLQTAHQKPIIAGFISRQTPVDPAKLSVLQNTLDPALLNTADVDIVILFREWDDALNTLVYETLGSPIYESPRIAVFRVPTAQSVPGFQIDVPESATIQQSMDSYVYMPSPGWIVLQADVSTVGQRTITIQADEQQIHTLTIDQSHELRLPILLNEGYHTLSIDLDPPCPESLPHPNLVCREVMANNIHITEPIASTFTTQVNFDAGITLNSAYVAEPVNNQLKVWLSWEFTGEVGDNLVRFVHLIDENGNQITGSDVAIGATSVDVVALELPTDLPTGQYQLYTGWYTYPDIVRLNVLTDVDGAVNRWVHLGDVAYRDN